MLHVKQKLIIIQLVVFLHFPVSGGLQLNDGSYSRCLGLSSVDCLVAITVSALQSGIYRQLSHDYVRAEPNFFSVFLFL